MCPDCYQPGGSLLHCLSTLTLAMSNTQNPVFTIRICAWLIANAVYFCCTVLGVASTGCYPASCPVKPGLSSPAVFRHLQPRSFVLLILKLKERRKNFATPLNIHYSFNFRKKIFFARKFFPQEYFFRQNFHCFYTLKQLPPINSRRMEFWLIPSLGIGRK